MKQMHDLMSRILKEGYNHGDRTGVGRRSLYNVFLDFDASTFIPVVNTQKVFIATAAKELCWMLGGHRRIDIPGIELPIWKKWMYQEGSAEANKELVAELTKGMTGVDPSDYYLQEAFSHLDQKHKADTGMMYPMSWRHAPIGNIDTLRPIRAFEDIPSDLLADFLKDAAVLSDYDNEQAFKEAIDSRLIELNNRYWSSYDQINEVFINMRKRPHSSRHRVSAWIPEWIPDEDKSSQYNILNGRGSLTPCHDFFQFTIGNIDKNTGKPTLNLLLHMGSADVPVGVPYNIVCYTTMLHIFANLLDLSPNRFSLVIGDAHIYLNQVELVKEQLSRQELPQRTRLHIQGHHKDPFSIKPSDLIYEGYESHEHLKYPVAV